MLCAGKGWDLCPLQRKQEVLTTGLPGKFPILTFSRAQFRGIKYIHTVVQPSTTIEPLSSSQNETLYPPSNNALDFPGGSVVKTQHFHFSGYRFHS